MYVLTWSQLIPCCTSNIVNLQPIPFSTIQSVYATQVLYAINTLFGHSFLECDFAADY
jgi:uncharacterized protein (DUF697 family)